MSKNIKNYVCPNCFEQINKCKCSDSGYYIIMVDYKMQYAIRGLNNKHYYTSACCEGHYQKNNTIKAYILFKNKPVSCPVGWRYKRNGLYFDSPIVTNKKKFIELQNEAINNLNKWVDSLIKYNWS